MAHFANVWTGDTYTETEIVSGVTISGRTIHTNEVIEVIIVPTGQESRGEDYLINDLGLDGTWIQTSYNATIRKNFAGERMYYEPVGDYFRPAQPYPSWELNTDDGQWYAPVPYPDEGYWYWDEDSLSWVEVTSPT